MPQSCITILQLLERTGSQTHKDIVLGTGLAPRTVRYALRRLKENGLIIEKFNFRDARQAIYQPKMSAVAQRAASA
ncbi:MAG: winged helix-turn-helix domain-containing protein [Methanocorpusculum sp.]|nr:winged helix-turn-helix domain-containing protein [Methanocorpusculum sp.]